MKKQAQGRARAKGSKLQRTELVTLRLDPEVRFQVDLATRARRQTVSAFLQDAVKQALREIMPRQGNVDLAQIAALLWHPFEPDRFVKMALRFYEWLRYDEQVLWTYIVECDALWSLDPHKRRTMGPEAEDAFDFPLLRRHWEAFQQVAAGEADPSILPSAPAEHPRTPPAVKDIPPRGPVAVRRTSGHAESSAS